MGGKLIVKFASGGYLLFTVFFCFFLLGYVSAFLRFMHLLENLETTIGHVRLPLPPFFSTLPFSLPFPSPIPGRGGGGVRYS